MPTSANYRGIILAIACPFATDNHIDEPALRRVASWLAAQAAAIAGQDLQICGGASLPR